MSKLVRVIALTVADRCAFAQHRDLAEEVPRAQSNASLGKVDLDLAGRYKYIDCAVRRGARWVPASTRCDCNSRMTSAI